MVGDFGRNMKLFNTLTKKIEDFVPINSSKTDTSQTSNHYNSDKGQKVGLYACGFTVYDYTHLGHLRKYTLDDILVRMLRHEGYDVNFIQNVTDVGHLTSDEDTGDDKLEKGAKKYGKSVWDVAKKFEDYFFRSMDLMGNLRPDKSTRATEHIEEQLEMVKNLEKKGFAYVIEDDGVYFDTSKFPDYGKMAGLDLSQQQEGARVDKVEGKRNPADFALWKFERVSENRAMVWESPWSKRSFPGWHIECSAMSMKYLGDQFDIHTGGIDHIPVHHTNEIAQSEASSGKSPFVKYWVHHNFLKVDGTKMSKSLGNFFTIDDVIERGFSPLALRLLFLTAHYRSEMNFTWDNLAGAQKSYEKLIKSIAGLEPEVDLEPEFDLEPEVDLESNKRLELGDQAQKYMRAFFTSMGNDLNTAEAVSVLWAVKNDDSLTASEKKYLFLDFDRVLGLGFDRTKEILKEIDHSKNEKGDADIEASDEIKKILQERKEARENKDWEKSDKLRDLLLEKGYKVLDSADGQKLEKHLSN